MPTLQPAAASASETPVAGLSDASPAAQALPTAVEMSDKAKLLAFILMTLGMFMALLDVQIVASSIAEIQAGLAATSDEISMIQTSYLIAEVIMIPLSAWLSRMMSTRWLFTVSALGFTFTSLACGLSGSIESMVFFRVLQGFLGGAMVPTVFAAGFMMFSGKKATVVPAVLGLVATLAPALGPSAGGLITEFLSWRWLFFINIVPGLVIALVIPRLVKIDAPNFALARNFDWLGAISLALFLGCLQYVLDEGPRNGWFDNPLMAELLIVSGVAGIVFVTQCLSYRDPLVDLRAFRHRDFSIGCALSFIFGFGLYGGVFLMPIYLSKIQGMNPLQIGTTVFVVGVANFLATPLTVLLLGRLRIKTILSMGFGFFGLSFLLLAQIDSSWGANEIFLAQAMRGVATMFCIIPVTGLALNTLAKRELAGASGLFNLMRNLGGAIGIATLSSKLFYDRFNLHYDALADRLRSTNANVTHQMDVVSSHFGSFIVDTARVNAASLKYLSRVTLREAFTMSLADAYLIIFGVCLLTFLLIPLIKTLVLVARPDVESAH